MKKEFHLIIYSIVCAVGMLSMLPILSSCSDSNEQPTTTGELSREEQLQYLIQQDAIESVLSQLAGVDSLSEDFCQKTYVPTYGKVLDASNPFVRASKAESKEQAYEEFKLIVGNDTPMTQTTDGYSVDLILPGELAKQEKRESFGKLTYHQGDGSTQIAYVDVEIPNMPNLQRIDFVPSKMWGDNSGDEEVTTAYKLGELVYFVGYKSGDKVIGEGVWMCVRENTGDQKGVLVHLDENCNENNSYYLKASEGDYKRGCWSNYFPSTVRDVQDYLAFLNQERELLELNINFLKGNKNPKYSSEVPSILPEGFWVNDYVYNRSLPAAFIIKSSFGDKAAHTFWCYHWRICDYYYLDKECRHGYGESKTYRYTDNDDWNGDIWKKHWLYSLSAIYFDDIAYGVKDVIPLYDPANDY